VPNTFSRQLSTLLAKILWIIGAKQECLDKIDRYLNAAVAHFILASTRPFEAGEVTALA
jgi:alkanesulfonate monooxygenase SsuD/methylene tetrahydromethanopterin reductase-like flavin-dependent oxidoreductase (luciferase family)